MLLGEVSRELRTELVEVFHTRSDDLGSAGAS